LSTDKTVRSLLKDLSEPDRVRLLRSLHDEAARCAKHEWTGTAQVLRQLAVEVKEEVEHPTGRVYYHLIDEDGEVEGDEGFGDPFLTKSAAIADARDRNREALTRITGAFSVYGVYLVSSCPMPLEDGDADPGR